MHTATQDTDSPIDATRVLLLSRTSTDGSVSPKNRWTRGPPEAEENDSNQRQQEEQKCAAPSCLPSLQQGHVNRKSYMSWSWLLEDEADQEPSLRKPADVATLRMPELGGVEQELLCQKVAQRLVEVGRGKPSVEVWALVQEYLRFMFLLERLEGMLTLDPPVLVDDVWQAHIGLDGHYTAFCERTFGQGIELEHREIDASQPVLYKNAISAYEHFFGTPPPAKLWPGSPYRVKGEEGPYGRRLAFVRLPEEKYEFVKEC